MLTLRRESRRQQLEIADRACLRYSLPECLNLWLVGPFVLDVKVLRYNVYAFSMQPDIEILKFKKKERKKRNSLAASNP